jgi:hypothetical protein
MDTEGHWQTYTEASTDGELPDDWVLALAQSEDGTLWVGTDGGLARLDKYGNWQRYDKESTNGGLPDDSVPALAFDQDGALWAGTDGGLARLDRDGRWQTYDKSNTNGGLPHDRVQVLAFGPDGTLWAGTPSGLAKRDRHGHWQTYNRANTNGGLPLDSVTALTFGTNGSLWIGTNGGGLARLDQDGRWENYTQVNTRGGLPEGTVERLAFSPDGSLWIGTYGGLARLANDGHWRTYTKASTNGGLPDDRVQALMLGPDGAAWIGTGNGLGHLNRQSLDQTPRIVEVIGRTSEINAREHTIGVVAFDGTYLTQPGMFRYIWSMTERGVLSDRPLTEITTRSSVYRAAFDHDGVYQLHVVAVDRFGAMSQPQNVSFKVVLPKPKSLWDILVSVWQIVLAVVAGLYALALVMLIVLTHYRASAFRILSDAVWAKWLTWPFFFLRHLPIVQRWVLEPWFKAVRRATRTDIHYLDTPVSSVAGLRDSGTALVQRLRNSPRLWLHGRSGMGKSSVFTAWERAYFADTDTPNLGAAVRQHGFILITLAFRHYAALPMPDANRPETWVLEAVRRQLEQFGFATRDLGLVEAMLKAGHVALAFDGTNEADRDLALSAFAAQFSKTPLLVTSQATPLSLPGDLRWEVWELPDDIGKMRDGLLSMWLGEKKGLALSHSITAERLSGTIVSGYDLRLLADLAVTDPDSTYLPEDRVALYRAMLTRTIGADGQPLQLEGLKQLAWSMVTQRRRRIVLDDEKVLGLGTLRALEAGGLRIVRPIGAEHEFRHDQMRAFLAALWLVEETPTLSARQKVISDAGAFGLNRRDQEDLWGFVAPLLTSNTDLEAFWQFANNEPIERAVLVAALQAEADERGITLVRVACKPEPVAAGG